ncbi:actin cortical patch SUR7/pH-response regulator pali [Amylostereum chailletii]|nr:actin cortical patch SUR7/pH-response regulator pali [Amylostereum chailletii]
MFTRARFNDSYARRERRSRGHAGFTTFILFAAFVLFLLVALSIPIIKPIYLLDLSANADSSSANTNIGTSIRFGVWGYCVNGPLNTAGIFTNNGDCQGPQLGYTLDSDIFQILAGTSTEVNLVLRGLTVLLILHPIAAGLALLTFLPVLLSCCMFRNAPWIFSLIFSILTVIVSSITLAADIALVLVARDRLKDFSLLSLSVNWGPGVWMVLAGVVCAWLSMILVSVKVCRCYGSRRHDRY